MPEKSLTIWTNYRFPPTADEIFVAGTAAHRLLRSGTMQASNLIAGAVDPAMAEADIVFGQPDPAALLAASKIKWVHLSSAGYDRYDRPDLRAAFQQRGAVLSTSSAVYEEPCAEHVFAMMLSIARQLPQQYDDQRTGQSWNSAGHRIRSFLLTGQTVVILSYGTIARRLIELLAPFRMKIIAVRRAPRGDEMVPTVAEKDLASVLLVADHVINILPGGDATKNFMNAGRFGAMKPGAIFYNIGRGSTVDQAALLDALNDGRLRFACLDVTDPEPLPPGHPLWRHPYCLITPHTAGGSADEFDRLARHFLENLGRFSDGRPLINQVIG